VLITNVHEECQFVNDTGFFPEFSLKENCEGL